MDLPSRDWQKTAMNRRNWEHPKVRQLARNSSVSIDVGFGDHTDKEPGIQSIGGMSHTSRRNGTRRRHSSPREGYGEVRGRRRRNLFVDPLKAGVEMDHS